MRSNVTERIVGRRVCQEVEFDGRPVHTADRVVTWMCYSEPWKWCLYGGAIGDARDTPVCLSGKALRRLVREGECLEEMRKGAHAVVVRTWINEQQH